LVEPEAVTFPAADGSALHGRLYRPREPAATPPPLILWVHGGPTDQVMVEFRARIAYFLDRGWAVFTPDHRGSTGHGRAYTQAMRHGWGDTDVADLLAAADTAAANGWGDPRRLVAMGGSAGGFAVLHLLARAPERFAAGVALFPVTDLFDLDEHTHRYEKHYQQSLLGPLPEAADLYRERSPVRFAERITAPLLLLHGSADDNVPVEQSTVLADRLRSLGREVELKVYDGEGHGWGKPATVVDEIERTEDFLRRHVLRWRA
ncbi:MAG TPA: alpha/beta fold hydrolase, partial [Acidimicrobiales bacterium]